MNTKENMSPNRFRLSDLKPEFPGYLGTSLADFFVSPAHRWLLYTVVFILAGAATFCAVWIYDLKYGLPFYDDIPLSFKGMYAWHTAANFAICLVILDVVIAVALRPWGAYDRRTVGKTWLILWLVLMVGFLLQRTIVYQMVDLYFPKLIMRHENYPSTRAGAGPMFLFMLPFWLVIGNIVIQFILAMQSRSEELLRIRIDTILEERARRHREDSQADKVTAVADVHIPLPLDSNVGPIAPSQIGHVTAEDHYLRIYYRNDDTCKETLIRMSLKEMAARLAGDQFIRIHRSHIVNLQWISGVKRAGREVRLTMKHGAFDLPVSRYRLPQILPVLDQFLDRSPRATAPTH